MADNAGARKHANLCREEEYADVAHLIDILVDHIGVKVSETIACHI